MPRNVKNRQPTPSEAHDKSYVPEVATDWPSVPVNVGDALDELGNKSGSATSVDNTLIRHDGTSGKIQGSGIVLNDDDSLGAVLVQTNEPDNPVKGSMWLKNG